MWGSPLGGSRHVGSPPFGLLGERVMPELMPIFMDTLSEGDRGRLGEPDERCGDPGGEA